MMPPRDRDGISLILTQYEQLKSVCDDLLLMFLFEISCACQIEKQFEKSFFQQ